MPGHGFFAAFLRAESLPAGGGERSDARRRFWLRGGQGPDLQRGMCGCHAASNYVLEGPPAVEGAAHSEIFPNPDGW